MFNAFKAGIMRKEISYSEFLYLLENDQISKVTMSKDFLEIIPRDTKEYNGKTLFTANVNDATLVPTLQGHGVKLSGRSEKDNALITILIPIMMFLAFLYFIHRYIAINMEKNKVLTEIRDLLRAKEQS